MLTIPIRSLVNQIVRQELQHKGRRDEALYLNFDLRMGYYTNARSFEQSRGLHLLYYLPPQMSYITVFSGITASPFDKIQQVKEWKHECTHDSCWADINIFTNTFFEMAGKINEAMEEEGLPMVAPAAMSEHNGFRLFKSSLFEWVKVRVSRDMTDMYRRSVELL
jgi:hypothetical protein